MTHSELKGKKIYTIMEQKWGMPQVTVSYVPCKLYVCVCLAVIWLCVRGMLFSS